MILRVAAAVLTMLCLGAAPAFACGVGSMLVRPSPTGERRIVLVRCGALRDPAKLHARDKVFPGHRTNTDRRATSTP